jgi:hypothetical protein
VKTVIILAAGIWLGRQLYLNYDVPKTKKREERIKRKVTDLLISNGTGKREASQLVAEAMKE